MNTNAIVQMGTIIITLIGAIMTYIVVPFVKSRTTKEQQDNLSFWVKIAVNAAEQIFTKPGMGRQKKQYVLDFLKRLGIGVTMEQLDALIESAVHEINKGKLLPLKISNTE